jgi:hypothetical protein
VRVWLVLLVVANLALAGYGWYASSLASTSGAARPPELEPDRIKLLPPDDPRLATLRDRLRTCVEWGAFTVADAVRAERNIDGLGAGLKYTERRVEGGPTTWWVYVAPQANRRAADRIAEDLKRAGVADFYVVQEDTKLANAISLGLFSSEGAATARRDQIAKLGVRDIVVQARESGATRVYVRVRDVPAAVMPRLAALRGEFAATEMRDCAG